MYASLNVVLTNTPRQHGKPNQWSGALIMLTSESKRVNIFWVYDFISSKTHVFLVLDLRSTPKHVPLKFRWHLKNLLFVVFDLDTSTLYWTWCLWFKQVYLMYAPLSVVLTNTPWQHGKAGQWSGARTCFSCLMLVTWKRIIAGGDQKCYSEL